MCVCMCAYVCPCPRHSPMPQGPELLQACIPGRAASQHSASWVVGDLPGARPGMCLGSGPPSRAVLQMKAPLLYALASSSSLSHLLETCGTCRGVPVFSSQRISKQCVAYLPNTPYVYTPAPTALAKGSHPNLHVPQELPPSQPPHLPGLQLTARCLSLPTSVLHVLSSLSFLLPPTLMHTHGSMYVVPLDPRSIIPAHLVPQPSAPRPSLHHCPRTLLILPRMQP